MRVHSIVRRSRGRHLVGSTRVPDGSALSGSGRLAASREATERRQRRQAMAATPAAGGGQRQAGERRAEPRERRSRRTRVGGGAPRGRAAHRRPAEGVRPRRSQQPELRQQPESGRRSRAGRRPQDVPGHSARHGRTDGRTTDASAAQPRVAVPRQGAPLAGSYDSWNRNGYRVYSPVHGQPVQLLPLLPVQDATPTRGRITTIRTPSATARYGRGYFYFDLYYNSYVVLPADGRPLRQLRRRYGYPTGELRLQVQPRDAQVFIDGSYAGTVDDFDGTFQSLRLEEGEYHGGDSCCQATSRSISTSGSRRARRSRIEAT